MTSDFRWAVLLILVAIVGCSGEAIEEPAAVVEEAVAEPAAVHPEVAKMQADCATAAASIADRQTETSLYERLGGRDAIEAVTTDVVRRHHVNVPIAHMFEGIDDADLIAKVTDFIAQAAGGDEVYAGADMVAAHAHLDITDEEFLAAGGDVHDALVDAGVGEAEIEEVMCMFASLRGEVVGG